MTAPIRTVIADDEPLARDLVRRLLEAEEGIEVCGSCGSGRAALATIAAQRPELVFLDIRMPDLDGLGVIRGLDDESAPLIILVTAFADHAVEAFEVRAFDYVLKPIDKGRFARAVRDARAAILNRRTLAEIGADALEAGAAGPDRSESLTHLRIRAGERRLRLPVSSIRFVEGASQYVQADFGAGAHLLSTESLGSLEGKLPPGAFYRIHRSYLVNGDHVEAVVGNSVEGHFAVLKDGRRLPISRRSRAVAEALMLHIADARTRD